MELIGKALVIWASVLWALGASAQTTPTVTSKLVAVKNRKYTVYDYADPAAKDYCVVSPESLKTVRGLLVEPAASLRNQSATVVPGFATGYQPS